MAGIAGQEEQGEQEVEAAATTAAEVTTIRPTTTTSETTTTTEATTTTIEATTTTLVAAQAETLFATVLEDQRDKAIEALQSDFSSLTIDRLEYHTEGDRR